MATDLNDIPHATKQLMLQNMLTSPAFAMFLDAWEEAVVGQIEKQIFDISTDPATTAELKRVRQAISGTHHPKKIVETLIRSIRPETQKPR